MAVATPHLGGELWQIDTYEAKARAADMLLDGETPPLP